MQSTCPKVLRGSSDPNPPRTLTLTLTLTLTPAPSPKPTLPEGVRLL